MAKIRQLGHKVVLKIDGTAVGNIVNLTPPGATRTEVDTTVFSDDIEQFLDADPPKIEPMTVTLQYDPSDAGDIAHDTIFFDADVADREVEFIIEMPRVNRKHTFDGRILNLAPQQITQKGVVTRQLTIRPTTRPVIANITV